jgi:putative ubiquitin-RnfH superfamily antitoxin RatB of RatAB toxin-antitoxin module
VREAIELSGVLARHPELELHQARLGVWGRPTGLDAPLLNGDRVEVYRSLPADPKEARRGRAVRKRERR